MAPKVNEDIARARHSMTHVDLISPPPMHDIYSIEDLKQLIYELKQIKPEAKVGVKLVSGANIGTIAVGVAKAGADIIQISGGDGGTGAAPISSMKHAGLPFEFGLLEAHKALIENGLREQVVLRTDGGLQSGADIVMAAMMGAQEFDFGKLLLVAQGCIMARVCEKNTCPSGIATHDPKVKAKYKGTKDQVVKLLSLIAEDVRSKLSELGARTLEELVGRTDLLKINSLHQEFIAKRKLDLDFVLRPPLPLGPSQGPQSPIIVNALNQKIAEDARTKSDLKYVIKTADRAIPATFCGEIAKREHLEMVSGKKSSAKQKIKIDFTGSAGQGFGVFLVEGIEMRLQGEANDSVAKTMSGGRVVIRPPLNSKFKSHENVIIGNCALYGATGGTLYVNGLAGDRFAVRNSGAVAVVEGTGLHACEYMTNGTVIILGAAAQNIGSGMTGGEVFLYGDHDDRVNHEFIKLDPLNSSDEKRLRGILEDYHHETQSLLAKEVLEKWPETHLRFQKYLPKNVLAKKMTEVADSKLSEVRP